MSEFFKAGKRGRLFIPGKEDDAAAIAAASECGHYVRDYEEECFAEGETTCFNCRYRRWTKESFECMKKLVTVFALTILMTFVMTLLISPVSKSFTLYASGPGDGSGGGKGKALELVDTKIEESTHDNLSDLSVVLTFSKNIANQSVKDQNMTCISLKSQDGQELPFEVIIADDQTEPDKKREIQVNISGLTQASAYTLTINKNLSAKSGDTLTQDQEITLTTSGYVQPAPEGSISSYLLTAVIFVVLASGAIFLDHQKKNKSIHFD